MSRWSEWAKAVVIGFRVIVESEQGQRKSVKDSQVRRRGWFRVVQGDW